MKESLMVCSSDENIIVNSGKFSTDLNCGECNVISLYCMCFSVNGSVCLVCCVFDSVCELLDSVCELLDSVCELLDKQFAICLGVVVILLLNVMELFSVGGGAMWDRPCMVFQRMCVLCL